MAFVPFEMERWQSTHEHEVDLNLSESGVHPLRVGELLSLVGVDRESLNSVLLEYVQSNGADELRSHVAACHPGASIDNVLVTNGSAEANFLATWELCRPGRNVVFMEPNYFQIRGIAANLGCEVRPWQLRSDDRWTADCDALATLVDADTTAIIVTSPNNPTGKRFDADVVDAVSAIAARHGAWIVADEVYRGAERDGAESTTFWGRHDRLIVTGGLSKAYGLPGLRVGWAVTTGRMSDRLWARKDYTSIAIGAVSERLASAALAPATRPRLLERTRAALRSNWPVLEAWLQDRSDAFECVAPDAGAIAFVRFELPVGSRDLAERLRIEQSCLLVPGAHFQYDDHLRIGFGPESEQLSDGLARLARVVDPLRATAASSV